MKGVDSDHMQYMVVVSNCNEIEESEKKAPKRSSKKRAWAKKANIIHTANLY